VRQPVVRDEPAGDESEPTVRRDLVRDEDRCDAEEPSEDDEEQRLVCERRDGTADPHEWSPVSAEWLPGTA
jgi:hypothetical protein